MLFTEAPKSSWKWWDHPLTRMLADMPLFRSLCRIPSTVKWQSSICMVNVGELKRHFQENHSLFGNGNKFFPKLDSPLWVCRVANCKNYTWLNWFVLMLALVAADSWWPIHSCRFRWKFLDPADAWITGSCPVWYCLSCVDKNCKNWLVFSKRW